MARRFGRLNPYRSRLRRCAMSGLRGYGSEMINRWGRWYIPRWIDREPGRGQRNVGGVGVTPASEEMLFISPSASPSASPSVSPSVWVSASASPSRSPSASPSRSPSASPSASPSPSMGWVKVADPLTGMWAVGRLCVYNGKIYGGDSEAGQLYEWNGTDAWVVKAAQLGAEADIRSLYYFTDHEHGNVGAVGLYAGTYPGGMLYKWNDVDAWEQMAGTYGGVYSLNELAAFYNEEQHILCGSGDGQGTIYGYSPTLNSWSPLASKNQDGIECLVEVEDGLLYAGTFNAFPSNVGGRLLWFSGTALSSVAAQLNSERNIYDLVVLGGDIYGVTTSGYLYKWDKVSLWVQVAEPVAIAVFKMVVVGSVIYAIDRNGNLYESSGGEWSLVDVSPVGYELDFSPQDLVTTGGKLYMSGGYGYLFEYSL